MLFAPYRDRVASTTMSTPVRRNRFWRCWESPGSPLCRPPLTPRSSRRRQLFAGGDADNASLPASAVFNPASDIDLLHSVQTRIDTLGKFSGYLGARKLETSPLTDEPNVDGTVWLEICPRKAEVYSADDGPILPVRLLVSSTQSYQLQVMWPVVRTVQRGLLARDLSNLDTLLDQMLPDSGYVVCPGIRWYDQCYADDIRYSPKGLRKIAVGEKNIRHESDKCHLWHKASNQKMTIFDRRYNLCNACKALEGHLVQTAREESKVSPGSRMIRTLPSSSYPMHLLSPASQKTRVRRVLRERKHLHERIGKYSHVCVTLDDQQDQEMAEITRVIDGTPELREQLNGLFLEADEHREGHGDTLQEIWETDTEDRDKKAFFDVQAKTSKCAVIVCKCVCVGRGGGGKLTLYLLQETAYRSRNSCTKY